MNHKQRRSNLLLFLFSVILISVAPFFPEEVSAAMRPGELEKLKQEEARLSSMLAQVRKQKLNVLRSRPLTIGIIGFGRFGQFIGKSFTKYGNVVGTSRSDYTEVAKTMGAMYIPLSNLEGFTMEDDMDVIVIAVSIVSFEDTVKDLVPHLRKRLAEKGTCPLIVDVLSVKEHARNVLLEHLPEECDILCTHPMFGPDSAKVSIILLMSLQSPSICNLPHCLSSQNSWQGQTFVYERTRIDKVLLDPTKGYDSDSEEQFTDDQGNSHGVHENSEAHVEGMDRMERFLR